MNRLTHKLEQSSITSYPNVPQNSKERKRIAQQKWRHTPKGKISTDNYNHSPKAKACRKRYNDKIGYAKTEELKSKVRDRGCRALDDSGKLQCKWCGKETNFTNDREIDHINGDGKDDRDWYKICKEIVSDPITVRKKCQLLCFECHDLKTTLENYYRDLNEQWSINELNINDLAKMTMNQRTDLLLFFQGHPMDGLDIWYNRHVACMDTIK